MAKWFALTPNFGDIFTRPDVDADTINLARAYCLQVARVPGLSDDDHIDGVCSLLRAGLIEVQVKHTRKGIFVRGRRVHPGPAH